MPTVSMTVNGKSVSGEVEGRTLLVDFLRNDLRMTGTHVGCDTSQCGACVVHVNGEAVKACTMLAVEADGAEVAHGVDEALALVGDEDFAVIGGAEIFHLMRDYGTRFELTEVHEDTEGDVTMPSPADDPAWREVAREKRPAEGDFPPYDFVTYERA